MESEWEPPFFTVIQIAPIVSGQSCINIPRTRNSRIRTPFNKGALSHALPLLLQTEVLFHSRCELRFLQIVTTQSLGLLVRAGLIGAFSPPGGLGMRFEELPTACWEIFHPPSAGLSYFWSIYGRNDIRWNNGSPWKDKYPLPLTAVSAWNHRNTPLRPDWAVQHFVTSLDIQETLRRQQC